MKVYVQLRLRCELYCVGVQSSDSARGRLTFSASLLMTGGNGQPYSDITSWVAHYGGSNDTVREGCGRVEWQRT